ncbi:MAG: PD40 domain-containing protein [Burkholderiales bacterium]|nr:PD40 domain-containing protein [Burkholderiales bacterium]
MPAPTRPPWRPTAPLRIGEFRALPASNEVEGPGGTVRLRPLLMDVLLRLAAQPGEVVPRERLIEDVWPRRMVNDEVLSRAIAELRTALGDDPRQPRYVETIPKAGYRLVAAVGEAAPAPPRPEARPVRARLVVLAVAVALVAAGALTLHKTAAPAPALAERIAAAQPLTADLALELGPRFSPDGQRVAFALGEGLAFRIAVQPAAGGARRLIGEEGTTHLSPVFFPDGRRLAYWRQREGDCAIVEHDLDSGRERPLLGCAMRPRARFDLSPDGKRLAVTATAATAVPPGIVLVDIASGAATSLTATRPGGEDDLYPRFSPDGRRIAFFRGTESHRRLWIAETADPASAREALPIEGLAYGAAWLAPEGPLIVAADWLGFRALTLVDLATREARLLGARGARFPDASPAGDLAWENAVFRANLRLVDPAREDAPAQPLWPSTRYTNMPVFSPDGGRVAFVSNRDGPEALYVAPLDGEAARVSPPGEHRYIRPRWAPDGRALYAVRIPVGAKPAPQVAVRVTLADGREEALEALGTAINAVSPSADGQWLYAGILEGESMRVVRAPAAAPAAPERLPLPPVAEFHLNATHLAYTRPGRTGASLCRLADLACEALDVPLDDANRFDWVLAAQALYYPVPAPGGRRLARYDLGTRKLAWVKDLAPTASGLALAVSPDETRLVVSRQDPPAIDLMIAPARR